MKFADFEDVLGRFGVEGNFDLSKMRYRAIRLADTEGTKLEQFQHILIEVKGQCGVGANYRAAGAAFNATRAEIQAETIRRFIEKINVEKADNPTLAHVYTAMESFCKKALEEPTVKTAYENSILLNLVGRNANGLPLIAAKASTFEDPTIVDPDKSLAAHLHYNTGAANQDLNHLFAQIRATLVNPEINVANLVLLDPNKYAWRDNNDAQWPLRRNDNHFIVYADKLTPGLSIDDTVNPPILKRSLATTSEKFHYVFEQLQMVREQYEAKLTAALDKVNAVATTAEAANAAATAAVTANATSVANPHDADAANAAAAAIATADAAAKAAADAATAALAANPVVVAERLNLKRLNDFQKQFIKETLQQAKQFKIKEVLEVVEPYQFELIARSLLDKAPLNGPLADPIERTLHGQLTKLLVRNVLDDVNHVTYGRSEAQRLGLLHRYITLALKKAGTTNAILNSCLIPELVRIQGHDATVEMWKEFSANPHPRFPEELLTDELEAENINGKTVHHTGLQSSSVRESIQDTVDVVMLKRFAQNLCRELDAVDGSVSHRIKDIAANLWTRILDDKPVLADKKTAIDVVHHEGADTRIKQNVINDSLKLLYKELHGVVSGETSLRSKGHFFNASKLKKVAETELDRFHTFGNNSNDFKEVKREVGYELNSQLLKENLTYNLSWRYLWNLGPHHNKDEAHALGKLITHLADKTKTTFAEFSQRVEGANLVSVDSLDPGAVILAPGAELAVGQRAQPSKRILDALAAYGIDGNKNNGNEQISDKTRMNIMVKLLVDEAKSVIDNTQKYGGRHGALKHGLRQKGSSYLYDAIIPTLISMKPGMTPEAREQVLYLNIYMKLIGYKEGFGRNGKPGRGKQEWAGNEAGKTGLLDEIKVIHDDGGMSAQDKIDAMRLKLCEYQRNLKLDERDLPGGHGLHDTVERILTKNADVFNQRTVSEWIKDSKELRNKNTKVDPAFYARLGVVDPQHQDRTMLFRRNR